MKKAPERSASSKNTLSKDLKTEPPLSEKDEVKNAEKQMTKAAKKSK